MKRIYILLISALCLLSMTLQARTVEEARAIASTFIQLQSTTTPAQRMQKAAAASAVTAPVELAFTQYQVDQTTPAVYVFNSSDKGFVLVSAEDNARAVLAQKKLETKRHLGDENKRYSKPGFISEGVI